MFKQFLLAPTVLTLFLLTIGVGAFIAYPYASMQARLEHNSAEIKHAEEMNAEETRALQTQRDDRQARLEKAQAAREVAEREVAEASAQLDGKRNDLSAAENALANHPQPGTADYNAADIAVRYSRQEFVAQERKVQEAQQRLSARKSDEDQAAQHLEIANQELVNHERDTARSLETRTRNAALENEQLQKRLWTQYAVVVVIGAFLAVPVWFFLAIANAVLVLLIRRAQSPQSAANNNA